jgi:hypothetical protein
MQTFAFLVASIFFSHSANALPVRHVSGLDCAKHLSATSHVTSHVAKTDSKVWSNDDIQFLRENAPISLFNPASTREPAASAASNQAAPVRSYLTTPYVKEQDADWYAREISNRREELDSVDTQLQQIANTVKTGEGFSDAFPLYKSSPGILLPGTIQVLQEADRELRSEIDDLQDLGRYNGLAPGVTR